MITALEPRPSLARRFWARLAAVMWACLLSAWTVPAGANDKTGSTAAAASPEAVTTLCRAAFAVHPQGPWSTVSLPDTWAQRGIDNHAVGQYRFDLTLDATPERMWALRLSRLSPSHEIRVNGHLISGDIDREGPIWTSRPGAHLAPVPPALLQAGTNVVTIVLQHPSQGGLSCLSVGPDSMLQTAHANVNFYGVTLPLLLNAAAFGFAVFIGLVWLRHREPFMPGTVPLLWGLASLRHLLRLITESQVSSVLVELGYFANSILASTLAIHLALTLGKRAERRMLRGLYGLCAVIIAVGAAATMAERLPILRAFTTPVLLALLFVALASSARVVLRQGDNTRRALFVSLSLLAVALLFDYTAWFGLVRAMVYVSAPLAMPYMVPFTMGLVAWTLLQRVVHTLAQVRSAKQMLQRRVDERTRDLRAANAAKSRFLAAASHDLRQPVVTIGLLIDLLREQTREPGQREMIHRVDEAVASMESFLAGLLDLSRFEAGTVTPRRQRVPLQGLFDAVASHSLESARLKGLSLRFRPTTLTVTSDPLLLEQILRNLVSNALRYTHRGGVLVAARRRVDTVWLQVWDTGIGIAPDQQSAVFEELVQLDNPGRESTRGFGLGLAIVQRAAAVLDHPLSLRSQPGRGSVFEVRLPRALAVEPVRPPRPAQAQPLAGLHLAVLDDDAAVLSALVERLVHWGADVSPMANLAELRAAYPLAVMRGIETPAAESSTPGPLPRVDLLVTDQRLPDGNGLQAIDWMREAQPGIPAVVITGNTEPTEIAALHASGVPVLHKPFRAEALLKVIEQGLGR